jgi:hypothetical protein
MTLLATEIHNHNDPDKAAIVFAADRRISNARTGGYLGTRKKIFAIPSLNAAIGYFGLAQLPGSLPMQEWLETFIRRNANKITLEEFSKKLAAELNAIVPGPWHSTYQSGFHIAGFNAQKQQEFWFVRNIDDAGGLTLGEYQAHEQFQGRDAPTLSPGIGMVYRNGDIRAHVTAWEKIDESFGVLLPSPGFRTLRTPEDYANWVRFKMEVIAYFYKRYQRNPIIARPIDVLLITTKGITRP